MKKTNYQIILTLGILLVVFFPSFVSSEFDPGGGGGGYTFYANDYNFDYGWGTYYSGSLSDTHTNNGHFFVAKSTRVNYYYHSNYYCVPVFEFEDAYNADTLKVDFLFTADVDQDGDIYISIGVYYTTGSPDNHFINDDGYYVFSVDDTRLVDEIFIEALEINAYNIGNRYVKVDLITLRT